jgi:glycosyltransferase involved in cell wall biosynthesis
MAPLRVLMITDWMPRHGGAEAYAQTVLAGLTAAGDEVRLLTSSAGSAANGTADFVAYGTERLALQTALQVVNPFAIRASQAAVRRFSPNVVFVHLFAYHLSPAVLWPLEQIPTVMIVLDYKIICPLGSKLLPNARICERRAGLTCWQSGCLTFPHWIRDQARYAFIKPVVKRANLVLACSRHIQLELRRNGIESTHLALPVAPRGAAFSRRPSPHPDFVFSGRLSVEKGVPLLVRAFARLHSQMPHARLTIMGDGPLRREIEALLETHGLKQSITMTGWLDQSGVERRLETTWALIAPALWAEPLGLVAPEAIIRGVPVVASATGGLSESVADGISGLTVPNGDEDALYRALQRIATGEMFPSHSIDPAVVADATRKLAVDNHVTRLRSYFREVTSRDRN